jgi:hypothetical protein
LAFGFLRARRASKARALRRQQHEAEQRERDALKAREAEEAANRARQGVHRKDADIDSFLNSDDRKTD